MAYMGSHGSMNELPFVTFPTARGQSLRRTAWGRPATTRRWQMYDFAVVALLALATLKLVDFLSDAIPQLRNLRSFLTFVLGVGATVLLDYSVFRGFGIGIRNDSVGVWITGFVVAGMTVPWRALFGYLTHDRATADETLGEHTPKVRAA